MKGTDRELISEANETPGRARSTSHRAVSRIDVDCTGVINGRVFSYLIGRRESGLRPTRRFAGIRL